MTTLYKAQDHPPAMSPNIIDGVVQGASIPMGNGKTPHLINK